MVTEMIQNQTYCHKSD